MKDTMIWVVCAAAILFCTFSCGYEVGKAVMCQSPAIKGRYISGKCYEAGSLREVKP